MRFVTFEQMGLYDSSLEQLPVLNTMQSLEKRIIKKKWTFLMELCMLYVELIYYSWFRWDILVCNYEWSNIYPYRFFVIFTFGMGAI